jgi:hypothetical protein
VKDGSSGAARSRALPPIPGQPGGTEWDKGRTAFFQLKFIKPISRKHWFFIDAIN